MRGSFNAFSLSSDCCLGWGIPQSITRGSDVRLTLMTLRRCPLSMSLSVLLLGFARLSATDRKAFLTQLNQFILASPHQRRSKIQAWEEDGGASTAARAEPLEKPM
jgi:hypothetical protein